MILGLILLPALAGVLALLLPGSVGRRALLVGVGCAHAVMTAFAWWKRPEGVLSGYLEVDGPGLLFLSIVSVLFLAASIYAIGYLKREANERHLLGRVGEVMEGTPESLFVACLLFFLSTMTMVTVSQHFGLLWVSIEATTLASAPLIYYHRQSRSLEAAWKYLLICSVGIGLALLGNFLLAVSMAEGGINVPLTVLELSQNASSLSPEWMKVAFIFFLVGYGTKMGLAPLHTWLPDAHSESPSVVSALLSGALLNCAFLGILRFHQVAVNAGQGEFCQQMLLFFGLLSMAISSIFILGQVDYKRLLAYSSVEHMGILAVGVGLGGLGTFGALLHAINHSLAKGMLFLVAGNILAVWRSKSTSEVRGLLRRLPISGALWVAGFLAITGSPPFGTFMSELTIVKAALEQGRVSIAVVFLALLTLIFVGMATAFLQMAQGPTEVSGASSRSLGVGEGEIHSPSSREPLLMVLPPLALGFLVLMTGVHIPQGIQDALREAARVIGGL